MTDRWAIYYADGSRVDGRRKSDWMKAPAAGVQAVVRWPRLGPVKWTSPEGETVRDRDLWTGTDTYDPFGYGQEKEGSLIPDYRYRAIWRRACGDR